MEEMLPMKISNWESIEYSEGINCPNENCDNKSYDDDARSALRSIAFMAQLETGLISIISHSIL